MSTIKVDGIRSNSASSDAITLASDGTCTANLTNRTNKNIVINGAMNVAQRGTSSTSEGYQTIDRFYVGGGGTDEVQTQAQVDVASGTTPHILGFRKALKITNGNQTSGAGSGDFMYMKYAIEAQDIANSGWNYLSSSSFITLSFYVKSSVAQSFKVYFHTFDGTSYLYPFETGSLSADTWTKVTKTIPGNSNLTFNNDNGSGLELYIWPFIGTDYTASSVTEDAWSTYASAARTKDATSTWYTTNDATLEITGVQLEVGSVATDFEHKCYQEELYRCYRYYVQRGFEALMGSKSGSTGFPRINYPVVMRTSPSTYINYDSTNGAMRNQNDGSKLTGISTYEHYDYGFASRGGGSVNVIYSSTYYADAEL